MKRFWKIWSTDYLQQLRSAHYVGKSVSERKYAIGDVVLLFEKGLPRQQWKLVRITDVYPGRDGRIRACQIRTSEGTLLKRPVPMLFPLEINSAGEDVKNYVIDEPPMVVS